VPRWAHGELEIYDNNRVLAEPISTAESEAFVAAVHDLAEAVVDTDPDTRRINIVAWHLNTLSARHRLPRLAATEPEIGHRRLVADLLVSTTDACASTGHALSRS
jgi:hypothetical protein